MASSTPPSGKRLAQLHRDVARRQQSVVIAGQTLVFECLDDLEVVLGQTLHQLPTSASPVAQVGEQLPHFGVLWPAAIALARTVAETCRKSSDDKPVIRSSLELGCGLALPSLMAKTCGIEQVVASDRHALVPLFLQRNAALNRIAGIHYRHLDWRQGSGEGELEQLYDLVMGSDLLYEPWQPGFLAQAIPRLMRPGGQALIADPGRRYVDPFVRLLEAAGCRCELRSVEVVAHGKGEVEVLVLAISQVS